MANSTGSDRDHDLERRLDRDLEREGGYRTPRARVPLTSRGMLRTLHEERVAAGVIQPLLPTAPTKRGGS